MFQGPVVIIQLHEQIRRISAVDPLRRVFDGIVRRLAGYRVAEHDSPDRNSSKQPDIVLLDRADPVWHALFVHLKAQVVKDICRILEPQMAVDVAVKMIACRVLHSFVQLHQLRVLRRHIDLDISRDPFAIVGKPLDQARILQGRYSHRTVLIIDL